MIAVLLAFALQAESSTPATLPEESYGRCLLGSLAPVDDDGTEEEWREGWRETRAQCRAVRQAWWQHNFAVHKARNAAWSDATVANTVERLLLEDEAHIYQRYRHPVRQVCASHCYGEPSLEGVGTVFFAMLQDTGDARPLIETMSARYRLEPRRAYLQYLICFASTGWAMRASPLAAEAVPGEAKAQCREIYDYFVHSVVKVDGESLGAEASAERARTLLDAMDPRMIAAVERERRRHPR